MHIMMGIYMQGNSRTAYTMEKEHGYTMMVQNILGNSGMGRNRVKVHMLLVMVQNMRGNSRMEYTMAKEHIYTPMAINM